MDNNNDKSREISVAAFWLLFCMSSLMAPSCSSFNAVAAIAADAVADADAAVSLSLSFRASMSITRFRARSCKRQLKYASWSWRFFFSSVGATF